MRYPEGRPAMSDIMINQYRDFILLELLKAKTPLYVDATYDDVP